MMEASDTQRKHWFFRRQHHNTSNYSEKRCQLEQQQANQIDHNENLRQQQWSEKTAQSRDHKCQNEYVQLRNIQTSQVSSHQGDSFKTNKPQSFNQEQLSIRRHKQSFYRNCSKENMPDAQILHHESLDESLRSAAITGDLNQVKELLYLGAGFIPDKDGRTPLHHASANGSTDVCQLLAQRGFDLNHQDHMGYTALHLAACNGHVNVVAVLVGLQCLLDNQDYTHGNAPIHEAAWNGFSKTLEVLVKNKANIFLSNKAGFTALHLAAQNGHNESSRVLLYAGCNPDVKNSYGDTALHTAARYGHAGVTRILLSARCLVNERNKNGDTALHIAAALCRQKITRILLDAGTVTTIRNMQNETCTDVAKRKKNHNIISIISEHRTQSKVSSTQRPSNDILLDKSTIVEQEIQPVVEKKKTFFSRKKKIKDKNEVIKPHSPQRPNDRTNQVNGFFSRYIHEDGFMYYKDLAGNVKEGPVGYTPVCQCAPRLDKLEKKVHGDRCNLLDRIDQSHKLLRNRIDFMHACPREEDKATRLATDDRLESKRCTQRIRQHLEHERIETEKLITREGNCIRDDIRAWVEDRIANVAQIETFAANDDSGLYGRRVFNDQIEPYGGRLYRTRSDETLSQSEYSMKKKKKRLFESRLNGLVKMKSWNFPRISGRRKERDIRMLDRRLESDQHISQRDNINQEECKPIRNCETSLFPHGRLKCAQYVSKKDSRNERNLRYSVEQTADESPFGNVLLGSLQACSELPVRYEACVLDKTERPYDTPAYDQSRQDASDCVRLDPSHVTKFASKVGNHAGKRNDECRMVNKWNGHFENSRTMSDNAQFYCYNSETIANKSSECDRAENKGYRPTFLQQNYSDILYDSNVNTTTTHVPMNDLHPKFRSDEAIDITSQKRVSYGKEISRSTNFLFGHREKASHSNGDKAMPTNSRNFHRDPTDFQESSIVTSPPMYNSRLRNFREYEQIENLGLKPHCNRKTLNSTSRNRVDSQNSQTCRNTNMHSDVSFIAETRIERNSDPNSSDIILDGHSSHSYNDTSQYNGVVNPSNNMKEDSGSNRSNPDSGYSCRLGLHERGLFSQREASPRLSDLTSGTPSSSFSVDLSGTSTPFAVSVTTAIDGFRDKRHAAVKRRIANSSPLLNVESPNFIAEASSRSGSVFFTASNNERHQAEINTLKHLQGTDV